MINEKTQKKIIEQVKDQLLTVFGLRTLSFYDPNYKGSYIGAYHKDIAYHNGTVWPWLMGSFIKSYVKLNSDKKSRDYAFKEFIKPMLDILVITGMEIFMRYLTVIQFTFHADVFLKPGVLQKYFVHGLKI